MEWKCTNGEFDLMVAIAKRAALLYNMDYRMMLMDLNAVHANGTPLDLSGMLTAEPLDFSHDVFGIRKHIDRETGKLGEFFTPRFTACTSKGAV